MEVGSSGQWQAAAISRAAGSVSLLEPVFLVKGEIASYNHSLPPASPFLAEGLIGIHCSLMNHFQLHPSTNCLVNCFSKTLIIRLLQF